jgi:hypothetical protein
MGDPARAPFRTWVEDRHLNPNVFDKQHPDAIPDRTSGMGSHRGGRGLQHGVSSPQLAWEARRRHTPCSIPIDTAWDMDTLYLRGVEEERYVKALAEFTASAPPSIGTNLHPDYLLLSRPFLPRPWLTSGRKTIDPEREFPRQGQVQLPHEVFARDSGYAFYIASLMAGEGDPGGSMKNYARITRTAGRASSLAGHKWSTIICRPVYARLCIRVHRRTGRSGNVR